MHTKQEADGEPFLERVVFLGQQFAGLFSVRPAGRTYLEVKVLYSPDKGKS
jgi:hypothetical protein